MLAATTSPLYTNDLNAIFAKYFSPVVAVGQSGIQWTPFYVMISLLGNFFPSFLPSAGSVTLGPPPRAELCRARRSRADGAARALLVRAPRGGVARQAAPHHQTDLVHRGATFAFVTRAPVR